MKCKQMWKRRRGLSAILVVILLCLSMVTGRTLDREKASREGRGLPPALQRILDASTKEEQQQAERALKFDSYMADASLEVREHEDFLLTPALLVQEAVSDGVILTYPEE